MITVTKKDLIALGYGTSFSADIIRKAKKLMIEKGNTIEIGQVPKKGRIIRITLSDQRLIVLLAYHVRSEIMAKDLLRKQITELIISELI